MFPAESQTRLHGCVEGGEGQAALNVLVAKVLRHLANAARLLDESALQNLRLMQSLTSAQNAGTHFWYSARYWAALCRSKPQTKAPGHRKQ